MDKRLLSGETGKLCYNDLLNVKQKRMSCFFNGGKIWLILGRQIRWMKKDDMMKQSNFGNLSTGENANRFMLESHSVMQITVTDFGALVLSIMVKDKEGESRDVVLGFEKLEDYFQTDTGMGAYVGRNANRIQGARVTIDGTVYTLNANDGRNNLHSGFDRSHCKMYQAKTGEDSTSQYVEFYRVSPHLEQGFPGNLE